MRSGRRSTAFLLALAGIGAAVAPHRARADQGASARPQGTPEPGDRDPFGAAIPPWREPDDLPLPAGARSVATRTFEQAIFSRPDVGSPRRGTAIQDVPLPFFGAKRGPGCAGRWLAVGPLAWVCQDTAELVADEPIDASSRLARANDSGLPYRYFFVGARGADGFANLSADLDLAAPDQQLEPGFAVAAVQAVQRGGEIYVRTHRGLWIAERDLVPVVPTAFHGEPVGGGGLDLAWVVVERASGFREARPGSAVVRTRRRFDLVHVRAEQGNGARAFVQTSEGDWLRARDVRRPTSVPAPPEVRPNERWIDVDLATQTLVAYEGDHPVFATLISSGKGAPGTDEATPLGTFRIWVKLETSDMNNLEDEEAQKYYAIEDVPYVQFFAGAVALHGAFWHRGFGQVRSHGCVNLAPLDAQWLFAFTGPPLPAGWSAALPTPLQPGTVVRVR